MCVAGAEFAARTKYKNDKLAKAGPKWAEILAVTAPNAEADDAAKAVTTKTLEDISKSFPGSEKDMIDSFARNCGGEGEPEKFAAEHGVQLKPASVQGGQ